MSLFAAILNGVEVSIKTIQGHQLLMGALLNQAALFQNHNLISIFYSRKAMGDDEGGSADHQAVQGLLHYALAFRIQSRGCLIQNEDLGILEYCPLR